MKKRNIIISILLIVSIIALIFITQVDAKNEKTSEKEIVKNISKIQSRIIEEKEETKKLEIEKKRLEKILKNDVTKEVVVLKYNDIYNEKDKDLKYIKNSNSNISNVEFEKQMKYLKDNDYYVATPDELKQFLDPGRRLELPKKTVLITFDDGYTGVEKFAFPILKKYNFEATLFIPGYEIRKFDKKIFTNQVNYLSYNNLKKISNIIDIQSKTYNLYNLQGRESLYKISNAELIDNDFYKMNDRLNIKYFAYPNIGDEKLHHDILEKYDIELAFSLKEGRVNENTPFYNIPRYSINKNVSFEQFKEIVK